jgi:hypothetical protein
MAFAGPAIDALRSCGLTEMHPQPQSFAAPAWMSLLVTLSLQGALLTHPLLN